jgi:hypothetical protein
MSLHEPAVYHPEDCYLRAKRPRLRVITIGSPNRSAYRLATFWFRLDHRETRREAASGDRPPNGRDNLGRVAFSKW